MILKVFSNLDDSMILCLLNPVSIWLFETFSSDQDLSLCDPLPAASRSPLDTRELMLPCSAAGSHKEQVQEEISIHSSKSVLGHTLYWINLFSDFSCQLTLLRMWKRFFKRMFVTAKNWKIFTQRTKRETSKPRRTTWQKSLQSEEVPGLFKKRFATKVFFLIWAKYSCALIYRSNWAAWTAFPVFSAPSLPTRITLPEADINFGYFLLRQFRILWWSHQHSSTCSAEAVLCTQCTYSGRGMCYHPRDLMDNNAAGTM